jgi:hypothetical protein
MIRTATAVIFLTMACGLSARAEEPAPAGDTSSALLQLSLFPPVQLVESRRAVAGFRLGIVPVNSEMVGLDIGAVTWTSGDLAALQIGLVNVVEGEAVGVQFAWANIVAGRGVGWQSAPLNITGDGYIGFQQGLVNINGGRASVGLQLGAVNYASQFTGLMIGLVNITPRLGGLQIGIVNYAGNSALPVFPIANAVF